MKDKICNNCYSLGLGCKMSPNDCMRHQDQLVKLKLKKYVYDKVNGLILEKNDEARDIYGFIGFKPRKNLPMRMTSGWLYISLENISCSADTIEELVYAVMCGRCPLLKNCHDERMVCNDYTKMIKESKDE